VALGEDWGSRRIDVDARLAGLKESGTPERVRRSRRESKSAYLGVVSAFNPMTGIA
jgi:hypothetical protein